MDDRGEELKSSLPRRFVELELEHLRVPHNLSLCISFCTGLQLFAGADHTMPGNNPKKRTDGYESDSSYAMAKDIPKSRDDSHATHGRDKRTPAAELGEPQSQMMEFVQSFFQQQMRLDDVRREDEAKKEEARRQETQQLMQTQFEYQQQLMKVQAQNDELMQERDRKDTTDRRRKDAIIAALPKYSSTVDLEDFISSLEYQFRQCIIPKKEWLFYLSTHLTGKPAGLLGDIRQMVDDDYDEVKARLLKASGYTERDADYQWFNTKTEDIRSLTADQLLHKGRHLLRRRCAACPVNDRQEFLLVRERIRQVVPKRAKTALDNRKWDCMEELADALRDYLAIEGEFGPDKSQPFKTQAQGAKEGRFSCFKCGAPDHKAVDCHVSKLSVQ